MERITISCKMPKWNLQGGIPILSTFRNVESAIKTWRGLWSLDQISTRGGDLLWIFDIEEWRNPEFHPVPDLQAIWGRISIDYSRKVMEGARCLTQLGSKSDGVKESRRLDRYSRGWQFPHTFCMESSNGYWERYFLPKIDLESGRTEYRGRFPSRWIRPAYPPLRRKPSTDTESIPKGRAKAECKLKGARVPH